MANSKAPAVVRKPRPDFPLFPHATGRWAKKVCGKLRYFGKTAVDPEGKAALDLWLEQKDALLAGRVPRAKDDSALTLAKLCNLFLTAKLAKVNARELGERTFCEYHRITDLLIDTFGKDRLVSDLQPTDFQTLYEKLEHHSVVSRGREITMVRSVFKFAADPENGLPLERPVRFGITFKAPGKIQRRIASGKRQREHGHRMFTPAEIKAMLHKATPQLHAMILLGINGGLGNTDCSSLTRRLLDLEAGWLDYPRPKTGVDRKIPLWPETVKALRAVLDDDKRPEPRDPDDADLVFITRCGQPWVRFELAREQDEAGKPTFTGKAQDAVATATAKLLRELNITRNGRGFYALRHTFETIGGASKDQVAVDCIMGHADETMAAEYRELIYNGQARLGAVVDAVHAWLFAGEAATDDAEQPKATRATKPKRQRMAPAAAA